MAEQNRKRRRRPGAAERRAQIETVAARAFCRLGYGGASMRDIARELGTTQAAVYYHFPGKEAILLSIIGRFTDDLHALLKRELDGVPDPAKGLRRALLAHILVLETHGRETRLVIEEKRQLGPAHRRSIQERELAIYALYRDRVRELIAARRARALDPAAVTFALFGIVNYFFYWFRSGGRLTLREAALQSIDLVLQGLLRPAPAVSRAARTRGRPGKSRSLTVRPTGGSS